MDETCVECSGSGVARDESVCPWCRGTGLVEVTEMFTKEDLGDD